MTDPLTEARRLLFRADDILTGPDGASVWWAMQALADEVERLRATDLVALMQRIDSPKIRVMPNRYFSANNVLVLVAPDVYQRLLAASTPDEVTP